MSSSAATATRPIVMSHQWWPSSIDSLVESYEQFFEFDVSQPNVFHKYTHTMPIITVFCYLLMVFCLPPLLRSLTSSSSSSSSSSNNSTNNDKSKSSSKNDKNDKNDENQKSLFRTVLKWVMATWNLGLSTISAMMFLGITIPYFNRVMHYGLLESMCDSQGVFYQPSSMIFWAHYFVLSKYAELLDTVLLIVKNPSRPVPFLHYYHHATVLLFSWYAEVNHFTVGFWFCMINAIIHAFMYFYYFLTELGYRPTWAKVLTLGQISQMVAGIVLTSLWYRQYLITKSCDCKKPTEMIVACILMYGSYLFLFVRFFVSRYLRRRSAAAAAAAVAAAAATTTAGTENLKEKQQ